MPELWSAGPAFAEAREAWRDGRPERARDIMEETYRACEARRRAAQPIAGDEAAMDYILMLVFRGAWDEAIEVFRRMRSIQPALRRWFFTLGQALRLAHWLRAQHDRGDDRPEMLLSLPLWGRNHEALWAQSCLEPLVSGDAAALFAGRRAEIEIFCDQPTARSLSGRGAFQALQRLCGVRLVDISGVRNAGGPEKDFLTFTAAHWATLFLGQATGADVMLLFADQLFAEGSLGRLGAMTADRRARLLFAIDLQLDCAVWPRLTDRREFAAGPGSLTADALRELFLENPALREEARLTDPVGGMMPGLPFRFTETFAGARVMRSLMPQLCYVSGAALRRIRPVATAPTDDGFVDAAYSALGGPGPMAVLTDPDEFLCATVELRRIDGPSVRRDHNLADLRAALLGRIGKAGLDTPGRWWAFGERLVVGDGEVPPATFLDEVARGRRVDPAGSPAAFVHDVCIAAFAAARPSA